jgi:trigger factor
MPDVDLGEYRSVRVPSEPEPVTDEQIDEYLANVRQEYAQWVPVERPAAWGDQVVIDMVGHAGDQEIMNNEGYEMILDEEATYPLPGFHQAIVGLSPGEEKTFELPVPEDDTDEAAAGQVAEIRVKLYTVKEEDVPPLDDELALMVGDYDTLEDLKAGVRQDMETKARQQVESEYLDKVLEAMVEAAAKVEYPPQAIDREADMALNQMERNLASSGMQLDSFLGMIGKTRETYKQELRPASEERLRKRLVLNKIAELEGLEVEDEEVEAEIDRMSEMLGEQAEQMREMLQSPIGRLSVTEDLLIAKAQERVVQIGKGEAPPLPEAEEVAAEAEAEAGEPDSDAEPEDELEPKAAEAVVVEAEPAEDAEPEAVAEVAEETAEAAETSEESETD